MCPNHDKPADVLGVHSGALGDVILFAHLLRRLGGRVTIVTGGEKGRLLVGVGAADAAIDFDSLPMHELFTDAPPQHCALPKLLGPCDRLISCFAAGNRAAELRLAAMCGAATAEFLPIRPPEGSSVHLLQTWLHLLGLRWDFRADPPAWRVPPPWRQAGSQRLEQAGIAGDGRLFVIHPGSGSLHKCWPLENFAELAKLLAKTGRVVAVLGPAECERWGGDRIALLERSAAVIACPPLDVLAGILARAGGYVGNDSGVSHLAAAVGCATVALFAPTRPEQFAPLGASVRVVRAQNLSDISPQAVAEIMSAIQTPA